MLDVVPKQEGRREKSPRLPEASGELLLGTKFKLN
jgi:hypothetical protein